MISLPSDSAGPAGAGCWTGSTSAPAPAVWNGSTTRSPAESDRSGRDRSGEAEVGPVPAPGQLGDLGDHPVGPLAERYGDHGQSPAQRLLAVLGEALPGGDRGEEVRGRLLGDDQFAGDVTEQRQVQPTAVGVPVQV